MKKTKIVQNEETVEKSLTEVSTEIFIEKSLTNDEKIAYQKILDNQNDIQKWSNEKLSSEHTRLMNIVNIQNHYNDLIILCNSKIAKEQVDAIVDVMMAKLKGKIKFHV